MSFLLDGYNLLHRLGRLTPRCGRAAVAAARRWLVQLLHQAHAPGSGVRVVFDGSVGADEARGLQARTHVEVSFSGRQSADDVIEDCLAATPRDRGLTLVSDDRRLRDAARRRGCLVLGCLDYAERYLLTPGRTPSAAPPPAEDDAGKPESAGEAETRRWLEAFRLEDDDPLLRDLF